MRKRLVLKSSNASFKISPLLNGSPDLLTKSSKRLNSIPVNLILSSLLKTCLRFVSIFISVTKIKPEFFPKSASHELTPNPFGSNVIKKYNCSNFLEFLKREVKDFMGSLDYTNPMEYLIDASWITKTTKGKFALEHTHGATDISGVYYIKTNEQDGNLFFKDPNERSVGNLLMDLTVHQNVAPLPS